MTAFGPQLIGETEKTIGAILRRILAPTGLTAAEWVTLLLARQNEAGTDLSSVVADRAHFDDAAGLVAGLTARGLLAGDAASEAGRALVDDLRPRIASSAAPIWDDLPAEDVAAAERVLNEVVARARGVLQAL